MQNRCHPEDMLTIRNQENKDRKHQSLKNNERISKWCYVEYAVMSHLCLLLSRMYSWLVWTSVILVCCSNVVDFTAAVSDRIFKQHQIYLVYVHGDEIGSASDSFEQYCQGKQCASLTPLMEMYEMLIEFVGHPQDEFVCIVDAENRLKYVLPIAKGVSYEELKSFQEAFLDGYLEPFYASAAPPPDHTLNPKCQQLVGLTLQDFLGQDEAVKVLFLTTKRQFCESCPHLLEKYTKLAEKHFELDIIRFGFIDVYENDSRFIPDEIVPYFLIFIQERFDDPLGVDAQEFKQLDSYVRQMVDELKKAKINHQKQNQILQEY